MKKYWHILIGIFLVCMIVLVWVMIVFLNVFSTIGKGLHVTGPLIQGLIQSFILVLIGLGFAGLIGLIVLRIEEKKG